MPKNNLYLEEPKNCTVYFDGSCPLCSKEIATYQKWRGSECIEWIDASRCAEDEFGPQLDRNQALAKLHVRSSNGQLASGSAAFILLWQQFPSLRWLTKLINKVWIIYCLDALYVLFLKIRPLWRRN
jgi:ubiquinone biosynthesis monooxygenase Coq7